MLAATQRFALFLNQYANLLMVIANLLLVLVTAVYAWLTWRTLKALRQASLREREARHLQEIKDSVIQPIVFWTQGTVFERFTGKTPELLTVSDGYGGKPRQISDTIDDPFMARRRLATYADPEVPDPLATWTSLEHGRIPKFLYNHTKQYHFIRELQEFDQLLEEVRQLVGAFTSFANECAKDITSPEIPQALRPEDENSMTEWTNPHLLATECIHSLLLGRKEPRIELQPFPDCYRLTTPQHQVVAKATQSDKLKHWREFGFEHVRKRWEDSNLPEQTRNLLRNSNIVRENIEQLLFTHSLGVDCELVSGKKRRH